MRCSPFAIGIIQTREILNLESSNSKSLSLAVIAAPAQTVRSTQDSVIAMEEVTNVDRMQEETGFDLRINRLDSQDRCLGCGLPARAASVMTFSTSPRASIDSAADCGQFALC